MDNDFKLLTEKEAMWAEMLMEVLQDNDIPCASMPTYGAAMVIKTGMQEWLKVYVPADRFDQAAELMQLLFSAEAVQE